MKILREKDARPEVLKGKQIAIVGYGAQGHAHALNLRDGGANVVVADRLGTAAWERAEAAGFDVVETPDAVQRAAVVMVLIPDERHGAVYESDIAPNVRPGSYVGFAHGFSVHYRQVVPAEDINVFMVAPKAQGHMLRRRFQRGGGVPCLLAVHQDPSGDTRDVGLAYACAIGGGRAGILETSFRDETETDLFGEQAVLCGGLCELVRAGFETLTDAGYSPELAYFECLHEVKLIADLIHIRGIAGMREVISTTARYGDLTRGRRIIGPATRDVMRQVLEEIRSGEFADSFIADCHAGNAAARRLAARDADHPIETVGRQLRDTMSLAPPNDWLDPAAAL